jgi:hypothetical protein
MILASALIILGCVVGIGLTLWLLGLWADSDRGRRHLAMVQAENRIRDAQTAAFNHLADAAEAAVYDATGTAPTHWPSDSAVGEVVEVWDAASEQRP